jgi:hypothetical protein
VEGQEDDLTEEQTCEEHKNYAVEFARVLGVHDISPYLDKRLNC